MKCKQVEIAIVDSFEEKSVVSLSDDVKNHIKQCDNCDEFFKYYRQLKVEFEVLPQPMPAENLTENTLSRCHDELTLTENVAKSQQTREAKTPLFIWFLFGFVILMIFFWAIPVLRDYAHEQVVSNNLIWLTVLITQNLLILMFSPVLFRRYRMDKSEFKMI